MTDEAKRLVAWFHERYPFGNNGTPAYALDAKRAQDQLIDLDSQRRAEAIVVERRLAWHRLRDYPRFRFFSKKFYRGPNAA
jgi:hypothetical protein